MTFSLSWSIEGDKQLSRRLRKITTEISDFQKPFKRAADHLVGIYKRDVFQTRGGIIDERWARLSPATVAAKARSGFPAAPLIRTGRMKRGFRSFATSESATIGNNTSYFKYHQSNRPRRKIPRRVMMKLGAVQREDVVRIFYAFIQKSMR